MEVGEQGTDRLVIFGCSLSVVVDNAAVGIPID